MVHTQEQKQSIEINSKIIQISYLQGFTTKKDKDLTAALKSKVKVMKENMVILMSK